MEFDDTQLKVIAEELDLILQRLCLEHKISPLSLSGIVLARLIHLNNLTDSKEDFGKLLLSIGNSLLNDELEKPESIH